MPVKRVGHRGGHLGFQRHQHHFTHVVCQHLGFGGVPTPRSPPSGETLAPMGGNSDFFVYGHDRLRKGVAKSIYLLGCARLVHSNM